ncbi:hypothetical protein EVAR_5661_1 [Eumeta japonica]|uniref:Uncharacterized protein n=1 Tax=Eumeta variegata TaxID=151549 RepID=A0A4C1TAA0_EUMVA|nr:hypothetical protein EVAR_5661_1 [Eumeta japonica]
MKLVKSVRCRSIELQEPTLCLGTPSQVILPLAIGSDVIRRPLADGRVTVARADVGGRVKVRTAVPRSPTPCLR